MRETILAGDIGGTKTTLALCAGPDVRSPRRVESYDSRRYRDFYSLLAEFVASGPSTSLDSVCLAVAGPVARSSVQVTNLPWQISADALASQLDVESVRLINDVEALGYAVPELDPCELEVLQAGDPDPAGIVGVLALGTGLGEACVSQRGGALIAHPSEGGHADFAPASPQQARLLESLWREHAHVSVERVCSGTALASLYRFVMEDEGLADDPAVAREIADAVDPTPAIVQAALAHLSVPCREAVLLLCDILAAEAGNLALRTLARGGVFLGGGMAPRLLPFLRMDRFRQAFLAKGRFSSLVERVPLAVVLAPQAVLWGAALCTLLEDEARLGA